MAHGTNHAVDHGRRVRLGGVRRGSFLVIAIGVLALVAVAALLFASLGLSDRERSAALVRKDSMDAVPRQVGDYVARVIGDSALDYTQRGASGNAANPPVRLRKAWDYPISSWRARLDLSDPDAVFNPIGGAMPVWWDRVAPAPTAQYDAAGTSPWLASTAPTNLDPIDGPTDANRRWLDVNGWAHITHIAPDGNFVNLSNLRESQAGFRATPYQMRQGLDVWVNPTTRGGVLPRPGGTTAVNPGIPAFFANGQRFSFRAGEDSSVDQSRSVLNQWADADGDGFLDARWFEMVDATNPNSIVSLLSADPKLRFFAAARVVDLSALVNVNTASSGVGEPSVTARVGLSPSEVDLGRLLTMSDEFERHGLGLSGAAVPGAGPDNYAGYRFPQAYSAGHYGLLSLQAAIFSGVTPPGVSEDFGVRVAGDDIAGSFMPGVRSPFAQPEWNPTFRDGPSDNDMVLRRSFEFALRNAADANISFGTSNGNAFQLGRRVFGVDDLFELLTYHGANDPAVTSDLEAAIGGRGVSPLFSPLRENRSRAAELLRDRLRGNTPGVDAALLDAFRLQRLMDVRSKLTTVSLSREIRSTLLPDGAQDVLREAELKRPALVYLLGATDPQPVTISGLGTLQSQAGLNSLTSSWRSMDSLFRGYTEALMPYAFETDVWRGLANPVARQKQTLFYGHRGPELALVTSAHLALNAIDMYDADSTPTAATLLIDADYRNEMINDSSLRVDFQKFPWWHKGKMLDLDYDATRDAYPATGASVPPLERSRLASTRNRSDQVSARAINVYGVEAQPFITAVASFAVYSDAPPSAGGDVDGGDSGPGPGGPSAPEITIRPRVEPGNSDFMFRAVAFQLHNPFNTELRLSDSPVLTQLGARDVAESGYPSLARLPSYHYIKFGGRTFPLVALNQRTDVSGEYLWNNPLAEGLDITPAPIVIPPGGTVVCFATSEHPRTILERLRRVEEAGSDPSPMTPQEARTPATFDALIRRHLRKTVGLARSEISGTDIIWIPEIDAITDPTQPGYGRLARVRDDGDLTTATISPWIAPNLLDLRNSTLPFSTLMTKHLAGTPIPDQNRVVELRLAMRAGGTAGEEAVEQIAVPDRFWNGDAAGQNILTLNVPNLEPNDLVLDRLRLPATGSRAGDLDARLDDTGVPRNGSVDIDNSDDTDNTGMTFTLWASARRPADPSASTARINVPLGAIPLYCIERKEAGGSGNPAIGAWNLYDTDGVDYSSPSLSDISPSAATPYRWSGRTPKNWRVDTTRDRCIDDVGISPRVQDDSPSVPIGDGTAGPRWRIPNFLVDGQTIDFDKLYPEATLNDNYFSSQRAKGGQRGDPSGLRLADMLLPLAIGPYSDPLATVAPGSPLDGRLNDRDVQHTTLSEALALTFGFEQWGVASYPSNLAGIADDLYVATPVAPGLPANTSPRPFDRGQLVLDDYVPFYDTNNDGVWTQPANAQPNASDDRRADLGVPLALRVLDVFTVHNSALDRGVRGLVNVNTMPDAVARTVPMLCPPREPNGFSAPIPNQFGYIGHPPAYDATSPSSGPAAVGTPRGTKLWWWVPDPAPFNDPTLPTFRSRLDEQADLAATLISYRDRIAVETRPPAGTATTPAALIGANIYDGSIQGTSPQSGFEANGAARSIMTRVVAINEQPGLRSLGEVLLARDRTQSFTGTPTPQQYAAFPHNIDALGYDASPQPSGPDRDVDSSRLGVSTNVYNLANAGTDRFGSNTIANDYAEKVSAAAGALNSLTTRSDTFAVWFLVAGFQESDTTGLTNNDPMTPTYLRRFVMVIDRSNVTERGQRPKVLLMKEVPVR